MNAPMIKTEVIATCNVSLLTSCLRAEFLKNQDNIPEELKVLKIWLVWKLTEINSTTGKFNKIPVYPRTRRQRHDTQGSEADIAHLGTYEEALTALKADNSLAGVGIALLPDFGIVALDVDRCIENNVLRKDVKQLTNETYCEISPSGTGVRAFWCGVASNGKNHKTGYELFHTKGFVTVTGNQVDNNYSFFCPAPIDQLDSDMQAKLEDLSRHPNKTKKSGVQKELNGGIEKDSDEERLRAAAENDPRLQAIINAGLYERDMGRGKHSIQCPFEDQHSDYGRESSDGDTVYFQPHTKGYTEGWIHCFHTHGNDQGKYWSEIGYDILTEGFDNLDSEEWLPSQPLPEDLPPVPKFDSSMLPDSLRAYIEDIAERMQINPDIPAIGLITAISAAIGRRVQIKPKQSDNWTVVPNVWGVVVAPPGYLKSPALTEIMKPLNRIEGRAYQEYEAKRKEWMKEKERIDVINSAIKSKYTAELKKSLNARPPEIESVPDEPIQKRYCVNNFSQEALGEVLMGNPNGVLVFNDELYGLLKMTEKRGNEGLLDFFLSGWNGDSPFTFDRIGRGLSRRIESVCIAMLGGIQPGRLKEYIAAVHHSTQCDSGLLQRFQLTVWPDFNEEWRLVDREPNREAEEKVDHIFSRIVEGNVFENLTEAASAIDETDLRRFNPEAQEVFFTWLEQLELLVRGKSLTAVMASHLSKYRSLVPSLALIFAIADNVNGDIPKTYVDLAIRWAEYLQAHAERVYSSGISHDIQYARALLQKIDEGKVADDFKPADVYHKGWSLLDKDGVSKAVELLCELDYLRRSEKKPCGGGRPSITYRINPNIKN